jgi:hypothetical protein
MWLAECLILKRFDLPLATLEYYLRTSLRAQARQNIAPVAFDKAALIGASRMQEEVGEAEVNVLLDELDVSFQKKLAEQRWVAES